MWCRGPPSPVFQDTLTIEDRGGDISLNNYDDDDMSIFRLLWRKLSGRWRRTGRILLDSAEVSRQCSGAAQCSVDNVDMTEVLLARNESQQIKFENCPAPLLVLVGEEDNLYREAGGERENIWLKCRRC